MSGEKPDELYEVGSKLLEFFSDKKEFTNDLKYIATLLGFKNIDEAWENNPKAVTLYLVGRYLEYVQHIIMIGEVVEFFKKLGLEPYAGRESVKFSLKEILRDEKGKPIDLREVKRLYKETLYKSMPFVRQTLHELEDPWLKRWFEALFKSLEMGKELE